MIARAIATAAALFAFGAATPALACSIVASRPICDGGAACTDAVVAQMRRERAQREAIEYGRAMAVALEARREAPALDRAQDVARLVLPLLVTPVDFADGGGCGPDVSLGNGGELIFAVEEQDFERDIRARAGQMDARPLARASVAAVADSLVACQVEATRSFATYLASAIPPQQLAELWGFLVPRAGPIPLEDPTQALEGWRLVMRDPASDALIFNSVPAPQHIEGRRERAWQYLQNHRNGKAVMSAVTQFLESRLVDGRGEAAICPVAHAETQRLIAQLAM